VEPPQPNAAPRSDALTQQFRPPQPIYVPYQPPVTQQSGRLEQVLESLQQSTERNGEAFANALRAMQQNQNQAPAAEALPPQTAPRTQLNSPEELPHTPGVARVVRGEGDDQLNLDVQNSDLRHVLELISAETQLNILTSKNVSGNVSATLRNVDVYTALTALLKSTGFVARREGEFVFIGTPQDLDDMDRNQDVINTRVYRPNYVRASELQQLITPLLSQSIGKVSVSSASDIDIPADTVKTGGDGFAGTDVVIVRDFEKILRQIDQTVAEVDVQPTQVAIEAMILSVKLDDEFEFGVDFQLLRDRNNVRLVSGSPLANLAQLNLSGDGLRFGFLDSSTAVFINALETIGETNVVASPRVLCLNKQRAEILIGRQIGYVSTTVTENASTQSVEFLEVGTQLRIRPYISNDGTIRLEVHPELSTGTVTVQEGFTLPEKEVTQVTTNVMCHDGSTVVIGGLIREDLTTNTTQIPWLGNLPFVGPAFRQKLESTDRHEVIILITPRLVSAPALAGEGKQAQREFAVRHANYADKMSPIAKRNYAKHYLRLAYAAWNAGDTRTALRYSNLAVHFDPMNLEASNLRSEVAATMPEHDNRLHYYLKDGLRPWEHPHRDYTNQGFPWSPGNPPDGDVPIIEPYDRGVPGPAFTLDPGPPPVRGIEP
jgi:type IV pilus assembly protein PilQ